MLTFANKDPDESLDYTVKWGAWLTANATLSQTPGDCTVAQDGTSEPGELTDLVIDSVDVDSDDVVVWLSGGTGGETYTLLVTVMDDQTPQRTAVRRVQIYVVPK